MTVPIRGALLAVIAQALVASPPGPQAQSWGGAYGGPVEPGSEVVHEATGWRRLWRGLDRSAPPLPDFSRWCAVAAFAGVCPTGGFRIVFEAPEAQGTDVVIRWRVVPPGSDVFVTQALTRPWRVELVPKPQGAVRIGAPERRAGRD